MSGEEQGTKLIKYSLNQLDLLAESLPDARVITIIPPYSRLDVLESDGSWFKLKYHDQEGYALHDWVSTSKYTTETVHLKSQPRAKSITMVKIPKNSPVEVIGLSGEWSQIFYENRLGFILNIQMIDHQSKDVKPKTHSKSLSQINLFK